MTRTSAAPAGDIIEELARRWRTDHKAAAQRANAATAAVGDATGNPQADRVAAAVTSLIELRDEIEDLAADANNHAVSFQGARAGIDTALTWLFSIAPAQPSRRRGGA